MKSYYFLILCVLILCVSCNKTEQKTENENQNAEVSVVETETILEPASQEAAVLVEAEEDIMPANIVSLDSLAVLPKGCSEETSFGLDLDYKGYAFEASLYPLHDDKEMPGDAGCRWIVLSHWCLDEEDVIYRVDEKGSEVPAQSLYKDPFEGIRYPVITTDSVSFMTRNYGGQTLNFYATSSGEEVFCSTNYNEINLWVLDADPVSRRALVYSDPSDRCWTQEGNTYSEEDLHYIHPYVELRGWIDEEWICANLLSTCP